MKDILQQFADVLTNDVKIVSKGFAPTITNVVTDNSIEILGSPYISVLIDGRAPTRNGATKGNPTLQEVIYSWIQKKGIQPYADKSGREVTQKSLSWIISSSIHRNGTVLYQQIKAGAKPKDTFDRILSEQRIKAFSESIGGVFATNISSDLIKDFK